MSPQNKTTAHTLHFRPGSPDDKEQLHDIFVDAVWDLAWRIGIQDGERVATPEERVHEWQRWQPTLNHLAATADQFWVAEQDGKPVGYSRSILRDGVRELTEFFVSPSAQTSGIGRELLRRAMPPGARRAYIMATVDLRAQALYHKLGAYQICAVYTFFRKLKESATPDPSPANPANGLTIVPITPEHLSMLATLDQSIHGHQRPEDHLWLMADRTGFLLLRDERAVGYGYVGAPYSGPFALLSNTDYPVALAHAEAIAASQGMEELGFDTPMLNRSAIDYFLNHGYQMGSFFCYYMCDQHPAHVDKTIITGPMIMI